MPADYQDLKIFELERLAKEQIGKAIIDLQAGERGAIERMQQWTKTQTGIRQLNNIGVVVKRNRSDVKHRRSTRTHDIDWPARKDYIKTVLTDWLRPLPASQIEPLANRRCN
jgi:hypothetical protein